MLISFKMHTQDNSDYIEIPNQGTIMDQEIDSENQQKTSKIVLEMVSKYDNTFRIINIDRYYGSCITVMNLRKHGLLALCTTIENVKHYPKAVTFHKNEVTIYVRGSYRMASEDEY